MNLFALDKRHEAYGDFAYGVRFSTSIDIANFHKIREWCWENWGASGEYLFWSVEYQAPLRAAGVTLNEHWCWSRVGDTSHRIYFKSKAEYEWFLLKWGDICD